MRLPRSERGSGGCGFIAPPSKKNEQEQKEKSFG
jgi:hypothetical protein